MSPIEWDATSAAAVHAALAGVLAGLSMTVLTILGASGRMRTRVSMTNLKFLVLGMLLLIVAAVVFGGLAGQPHPSDIGTALKAGELTALEADVILTQSWALAGCAVTLLATGALCMFWGIVALAADDWHELTLFVVRSYALLVPLAMYEVAQFASRAVYLAGAFPADFWPWFEAAAGVAAILVLIATNVGLWWPWRSDAMLTRWPARHADGLRTRTLRFAAVSSGFAVMGYALAPDHTDDRSLNVMDWASVALSGAAAVVFGAFVVSSAYALRLQQPGVHEISTLPSRSEASTAGASGIGQMPATSAKEVEGGPASAPNSTEVPASDQGAETVPPSRSGG